MVGGGVLLADAEYTEEEEGGGQTAAAEVVLDVPATVGAAGPSIKHTEEVFTGSALRGNQSAISF